MPEARSEPPVIDAAPPWRLSNFLGSRFLIWGLFALVSLLLTVALTYVLESFKERTLMVEMQALERLSLSLTETTRRLVFAADLECTTLQERVLSQPIANAKDLQRQVVNSAVHKTMSELVLMSQDVDALSLTDHTGLLINSSRSWPPPQVSLDKRDFFQALKAPGATTQISAYSANLITNIPTLVLSRRISSTGGEFLGIVASVVSLRPYEQLLKSLLPPFQSSISLLHFNGKRQIGHEAQAEDALPPELSARLAAMATREAEIGRQSPLSEISEGYLVVTRAVPNYPLLVQVSSHSDSVLDKWQALRFLVFTSNLLLVALLAYCGWAVQRFLQTQGQFLESKARQQVQQDMLAQEKQLNEQIRQSEDRFRALTEMSTDWYWEQNQDLAFVSFQGALSNPLLSALQEACIGKRFDQIAGLRALVQSHTPLLQTQREHQELSNLEHVLQLTKERAVFLSISGKPLYDARGHLAGYRGTARDISASKAAEESIHRLAYFDHLTQLPNRRLLHDRLEQDIRRSRREKKPLAFLMIDLDHFKEVNDTQGHASGDLLLKQAAQRIQQCVRDSDTVARLGGDEFTVVLPALDSIDIVSVLAGKVLESLSDIPYELDHAQAFVSASIGIAMFPQDGNSAEELMRKADQAMYLSKQEGRKRYRYFTTNLEAQAQGRLKTAQDLRLAIERKEMVLHYQPVVHMASRSVRGAEALLRWQHPEQGLVAPGQFIAIAESSGLIVPIGDWVFKQAIAQCAAWRQSGHPDFYISVNKSPVQFLAAAVRTSDWIDELQVQGLHSSGLIIEITEGVLLEENKVVSERMQKLKDLGIGFAIDDFGTGYSSLSYLHRLAVGTIKIDQAFVRDLQPHSQGLALCKAIITLAHELGSQVVAEGVETEEQFNLLLAAGCDYAQGYWLGRPVPAADFVFTA